MQYIKNDLILNNKDYWFPNLMLLILYPCIFISRLTIMQGIHIIYLQFILSIICFIYAWKKCRSLLLRKYYKILGIVFGAILCNLILVGNAGIKEVINAVFIMPCLAMLLYFFRIKKIVALIIFYFTAFCVLFLFFTGAFTLDTLLVNSRNYVSYFMVLNILPYFVYCNKENVNPSILPPLMCLFIAVLAIGRGGILMALILVGGVLLLNLGQKGFKGFLYKISVLIIVVLIVIYGLSPDFMDLYFSRFMEKGLTSEGRGDGYLDYIRSLSNPINIILGTPIIEVPYVYKYLGGSLHNSYLTLHARLGFVGIYLIYVMIIGFIKICKRKRYSLLFVFAALLLKGVTDADTGGNFTGGDIYVYFLLLIFLSSKRYLQKTHQKV